jgi:hypothetical protein
MTWPVRSSVAVRVTIERNELRRAGDTGLNAVATGQAYHGEKGEESKVPHRHAPQTA